MSIHSKLVLGTVQFGLAYGINNTTGKPNESKVFEILREAYNHGIETLDTAHAYGDAEQVIGSYHRSNARFSIITKFHAAADLNIDRYFDETLARLNIHNIDTILYHSSSDIFNYPSILQQLADKKRHGLIKRIGASIYTNDEFFRLAGHDLIDIVQLPFNLLDNYSHRKEVFETAGKKGIKLHARSVFLQGLLLMEPGAIPQKLQKLKTPILKLRQLADEYGMTMTAMALRYTASFNAVEKLLIGVETVEQLRSNLNELAGEMPIDLTEKINHVMVEEKDLLSPVNWK